MARILKQKQVSPLTVIFQALSFRDLQILWLPFELGLIRVEGTKQGIEKVLLTHDLILYFLWLTYL